MRNAYPETQSLFLDPRRPPHDISCRTYQMSCFVDLVAQRRLSLYSLYDDGLLGMRGRSRRMHSSPS